MDNYTISTLHRCGELATLLRKLDRPQTRAKLRKVLKEEELTTIEQLLYGRMEDWHRALK